MPKGLLQPESVLRSRWGYWKPRLPVLNAHHPINAGLVGCWLLNDFASGYVNDLSPSRNNGLIINPGLARLHQSRPQLPNGPGPNGGIVSTFYGNEAPQSENRVEVPNSASLDLTTNLTLMCWQCPISTFASARVMSKLSQPPYNGYELFNNNATGFVVFQVGNGGALQSAPSTTQFGGGGTGNGIFWLFNAATYDGATGTIYSQGKAEASFSAAGAIGSSSSALGFGSWPSAGGGFNMSGYMDGIRVYNRVLSAAEILQLYLEPYAGIWDASKTFFGFGIPQFFTDAQIWGAT